VKSRGFFLGFGGLDLVVLHSFELITSFSQISGKAQHVYYRAKDQDAAVLLKEFEYELNEEVRPLKQDILRT